MNYKGLLPYSREIAKEVLNVIRACRSRRSLFWVRLEELNSLTELILLWHITEKCIFGEVA
jgi:hypothetical protein